MPETTATAASSMPTIPDDRARSLFRWNASLSVIHFVQFLRVAISNHRSRFEDFDLLVADVLRIGRGLP